MTGDQPRRRRARRQPPSGRDLIRDLDSRRPLGWRWELERFIEAETGLVWFGYLRSNAARRRKIKLLVLVVAAGATGVLSVVGTPLQAGIAAFFGAIVLVALLLHDVVIWLRNRDRYDT